MGGAPMQGLANARKILGWINVKNYGAYGNGVHDDTAAFNSVATYLASLSPSGGRVVLPPGTYYIADENLLSSMSYIAFEGTPGLTTILFGKVLGTSTGTIPPVGSVPTFTNCSFRDITFSTTSTATGHACFTTGSSGLHFVRCIIQEVYPLFLDYVTSDVSFLRSKFLQGAAAANSTLQSIGNVFTGFVVDLCEWNFAPAQGAGTLIGLNSSNLVGDYWITRNRFLDDNKTGYAIEAAIDIEPNGSTPLRSVHVQDNVIFNSRIYVNSCNELWVERNEQHFTSVASGEGASGAAISGTTSATTVASMRVCHINDNVILEDDGAYDQYKYPIYFDPSGPIEDLQIEGNYLQVNGAMTNTTPVCAINLNITNANASLTKLSVKRNRINYTSVPGTKYSVVYLTTNGTSTIDLAEIAGNTLGGSSGAATYLVDTRNGGTGSTITTLSIHDNDITQAGLTGIFINEASASQNTVTNLDIHHNPGYNPVGLTTETIPASGSAYTNSSGVRQRIFLTGGTMTALSINGTATGITATPVNFELDPGETFTPTYSVAPTMTVFGL